MRLLRLSALVCLGSLLIWLGHFLMRPGGVWPCPPTFCSASNEAAAVAAEVKAEPSPSFRFEPRDRATASPPALLFAQAEAAPASPASGGSTGFPALLEGLPLVVLGGLASLLAGLATGVGAIPILFTTKISNRLQSTLLGFAAGVMLAATSFSLLIPAIEWVTAEGGSQLYAAMVAVGGTLIGSGFIWFTDRVVPLERLIAAPANGKNTNPEKLKGIWLFILAIAIHNFPEGLAVGVGFGGGNMGNGTALAIGIGLQNLPEGLAVALALFTQHYSRSKAFWVALLTGLLEPLGGLFGVGIISLGEALLPWSLAFAAGAMLFVIGDEVIPEAQQLDSSKLATVGIITGFLIMMFLDVALSG